jgi:hypothetical protein
MDMSALRGNVHEWSERASNEEWEEGISGNNNDNNDSRSAGRQTLGVEF